MEQIIKPLIYAHAFFGGLGLIAGLVSIFVKKGGLNHRKAGKIFTYSMSISSFLSLIVSRMPNHENLFLFLIGIFTIYLVLAGNRALTLRSKIKSKADWKDKLVSGLMLITSIVMVLLGIFGIIQKINNSILYLFFGAFGMFLTLRDFHTFKIFTYNKNAWLLNHLGRMTGALIASITAFFVAGLNIQTIFIWFLPTIFGIPYIIFWNKKLKSNAKPFPLKNEEP